MKPIKTCYGEWVNPALVQYFSVRYVDDGKGGVSVDVRADGATLQTFPVDEPPDYPKKPADYDRYNYNKNTKKAADLAYDEAVEIWDAAYDQNKRKTRAEACAWLADFIKETFDEAD